MSNLALTYQDLYLITCGEFDRFEVLYNAIPNDGDPNSYIEDDGRQMRFFEFKDCDTGMTYNFSYVWHGEYGYEFPLSMFNFPDGVDLIEESVIVIKKAVEEKPAKILTQRELDDAKLWDEYSSLEVKDFSEMRDQIPISAFDNAFALLKTKEFTLSDIRAVVLPICIKYRIDQKSTWAYIQKTCGAWL